jgi:hypothetical protein
VALADLLPRFDWARLNRERLVIDQARLDGIG